MHSMKLNFLTKEYLETFGMFTEDQTFYIKAISKSPISSKSDEVIVFFDKSENILYDTHLEKIKRIHKKNPNSDYYFLNETFEGIPKYFITGLRALKIKEQVPSDFFDKPFKYEESPHVTTAMIATRNEANKIKNTRVRQPFTILYEEEGKAKQTGDVLDFLKEDLASLDDDSEPLITLIAAPGGFGKTVLMNVLFSELLEDFYKSKKKRLKAFRPFLMLPNHLKSAIGKNLRALIQEFCKLEFMPQKMSEETFNFLIKKGYGIWLFDGLEELFISEKNLFYALLEDYLTAKGSETKRIIITIRDALLATNSDLINTIQDFREDNLIKILKLSKWGNNEINSFFRLALREDLSKKETEEVLNKIKKTKELKNLISVPLYCSFAVELSKSDKLREMDEDNLLMEAILNINEREYEKGLPQWFDMNKQLEFLSALSSLKYSKEKFSLDDIKDFAMVLAPNEIKVQEKNTLIRALERHALFGLVSPPPDASIDFKNELLGQYLLGIALEKLLDNLDSFINEIERKLIPNDSRILIYLGAKLSTKKELWQNMYLKATDKRPNALINVLKLLAIATQKDKNYLRDLINRKSAGKLELKKLSTIKFENLNLSEISFLGSDLTHTEFINCDITEANFTGCLIKNTEFQDCIMKKAVFGDIRKFRSVIINRKYMDDFNEVNRTLFKLTEIPIEQKSPCIAAQNLRKCLEKIIYRDYIRKQHILKLGLKGGVPMEECIKIALKKKILHQDNEYIKVNPYNKKEIEEYVNEAKLSPSIIEILDKICKDKSKECKHIYS